MEPAKDPKSNRTAEVEPAIRHTVPWRVISVTALPDFRLRVTFVDGTSGDVDMRRLLRNPNIDGTVFEPLRDPSLLFSSPSRAGGGSVAQTARTSRQMRCMMSFRKAAFGLLNESV
jgi:hypothetical protein